MDRAGDPSRGDERSEGPTDSRRARQWSQAALVEAMRRNEAGAFREFFERFRPLLMSFSRSAGIPPDDRDELITELLEDVAMYLVSPATPVPRSIAPYLVTSLRRRGRNRRRDQVCRERLREAYAAEAGGSERVVASASSEDALRASHGPGWDARSGLTPAVERLAIELERGLSAEERLLLAWLSQHVPQREMAAWLGVGHNALRVRITRLRARLRDAALRYAYRLDGNDRAELDRFFQRLDIPQAHVHGNSTRGSSDDGRPRQEKEGKS